MQCLLTEFNCHRVVPIILGTRDGTTAGQEIQTHGLSNALLCTIILHNYYVPRQTMHVYMCTDLGGYFVSSCCRSVRLVYDFIIIVIFFF